jgi:hypothetical protein
VSHTTSDVLHEEDGILYVVAAQRHHPSIVRLLSESFCREPMSTVLNASPGDLAPIVERFMPECLGNRLSVAAIPVDAPDTIAGVLISRDFKLPMPEGVPDAFEWFLPIGQALITVDQEYERKRPDLKIGEALDLWMLGVDSARFGQRGIGTRLIQLSSDLARTQRFVRCVAECTGHYSQAAAQRSGFQEAARLAYADFMYEGRPVFAQVPSPHTHLVLYEKEL